MVEINKSLYAEESPRLSILLCTRQATRSYSANLREQIVPGQINRNKRFSR